MPAATLTPSRLAPADAVRAAGIGLRTRRLRSLLSALGIMIGIAAMVAVLGLSESSKSDLLAQLDALGTNMLQVQAGQGIGLGSGELPDESAPMVSRIGPVETVSSVSDVPDAKVYRNDLVPSGQTGGITVKAVELNLLTTLQGTMAAGVSSMRAPRTSRSSSSDRSQPSGSESATSTPPRWFGSVESGSPSWGSWRNYPCRRTSIEELSFPTKPPIPSSITRGSPPPCMPAPTPLSSTT